MKKLLFLAIAMFAAGVTLAMPSAQTPERVEFEVAALRSSKPGIGGVSPLGTGRWSAAAVTLPFLLSLAYDIEPYARDIVGLPDWASREYFGIAVKAEDGVTLTREELRPRLRRFIEERFRLVTHIEIEKVKGYALVVAQGGPTMKVSAELRPGRTANGINRLRNSSVTMDVLAQGLEALLNRSTRDGLPVVNETGLAGYYDVTLEFAPIVGTTDSLLPSIFTALQEQLGLRLLSKNDVPVRTLVIDRVERPTLD